MLALAFWVLLGAVLGAAAVAIAWLRDRQSFVGEVARVTAERDGVIRSAERERQDVAVRETELRDAFTALSRSALKENRTDFLEDAQSILTPVKESLEKVQQQLTAVDRAREGSYQAVSSQLGLLQQAQQQLRTTAEG